MIVLRFYYLHHNSNIVQVCIIYHRYPEVVMVEVENWVEVKMEVVEMEKVEVVVGALMD